MRKKILTGTGLLVAVVLFFALNLFSHAAFTSARVDLTEHRLYTLTEGTQNILRNLEEPITLRFYVSSTLAPLLPGISSYTIRVKELLEEFEQAAGAKIQLRVINPERFSEEEDRAVGYGLRGVPIGEGDTVFYFGLVGTGPTDTEETITFFQPEREEFLEYDLAKMVYQLSNPKERVVGLMSTLPISGGSPSPFNPGGGQPWVVLDHIRQLFQVLTLQPDVVAIPEEVDVLMIVHPKGLKDSTLYAIDQFVLQGGRALVFVDPYAEADQPGGGALNPAARGPQHSTLDPLFDAWGVELQPGKVVADLPFAKRVQYREQSQILVSDYPLWIDVPSTLLNHDDVATAQLSTMTFASAGALKKKEGHEIQFIPLVQTDDQAMLMEASLIQFNRNVKMLLKAYRPGGAMLTLAARLTGKVKSAFPNGRPPQNAADSTTLAREPATPAAEHVAESGEAINVIVVADTDLLQDYFWVHVQSFLGQRIGIPTSGNGTFVVNALDSLTGSNDLINVRTRGGFQRPFTLVRALQQDAERQYREVERELQDRKRETERKIQTLQGQNQDASGLVLSPEQEREIERFRQELVQIRKDLRRVQHELQRNIDRLGSWLKFANIGLVPILIGVIGLVLGTRRSRRGHPNGSRRNPS